MLTATSMPLLPRSKIADELSHSILSLFRTFNTNSTALIALVSCSGAVSLFVLDAGDGSQSHGHPLRCETSHRSSSEGIELAGETVTLRRRQAYLPDPSTGPSRLTNLQRLLCDACARLT